MHEHPGEGMTASRDTRPAPHIHHTGDLHPQQNSYIVPPGPQPVCAGPDHGQDRSSSLRCGRSVLTDGPHPALPAQRPRWTKTTPRTVLTEPHPFRDDYSSARRCLWGIPAETTTESDLNQV